MIKWPDLIFPPINLYSIWRYESMKNEERKPRVGDAVFLHRIKVSADLTEASVEDLIEDFNDYDKPKTLICHPQDAVMAGRVASKFGLDVIVMPSEIFEIDAWALVSDYSVGYSPGAINDRRKN